MGKPWTFGVPNSYPDEILTLPPSDQVSTLLLRAPVALLDANRFRSPVHVQPGLLVPIQVQHDLSASLKFMFETKIDRTLIEKAYADLVRRIRWKWHFMDQVGDSYDPDYDVDKLEPLNAPNKKRKAPPLAAPHIERGLEAGADYVRQIVTSLPSPDSVNRPPVSINVKRAQDFVVANNLIVTSTDKNLGVAVFKREWIKQQSDSLFGDEENYTPYATGNVLNYLNTIAREIESLCDEYLGDEKQLSTFLRHNLPGKTDRNDWVKWARFVPEAYAIPKIHKNPWKGRPICPGFCLPQNAASKFCAKLFRPYIDACPWVIQGSKDFVQKLADVKIPTDRKAFIVSADVVAFYPSVDVLLLSEFLDEFVRDVIIPGEVRDNVISVNQIERRKDYYSRMFSIALCGPVMTYLDKVLVQRKGLPMGAAGSPDMANMFGLKYEREWHNDLRSDENVLFFGRYLDDIYTVVLADSPDEAAYRVESIVHYGDVKLLWELPADKANFLDLATEIRGDRIYHEPFVKAMSHRERIPWLSAHPKDVKKGTFSSEISRLATLCSDYDVYASQCQEAVNLYIGRGYPKGLVTSWLEQQKEKRWVDRVAPKAAEDPACTFFSLKTHFNEAWKGFNVHELESRITSKWKDALSTPIFAGDKRKKSKGVNKRPAKKTVNLGLRGTQFPGQSRLVFTHEDGTEMVNALGRAGGLSEAEFLLHRKQEQRWTQKWIDTGRFIVSRRKNTQLWDVTRGWNRSVWNAFMAEVGMLRPFDPMNEGYIMPDIEDVQD